jgi:preprotein translocase subunit SecG
MKRYFLKTKVLILIGIFLISSFGLYVTGTNELAYSDIEIKATQDNTPEKVSWEPPPYTFSSRALQQKPGTYIRNEGSVDDGYFLGDILPTFYNDYSSLSTYLKDADIAASANAVDKPAFPGTTDLVYTLTLESTDERDTNQTNGDEMLYQTKVSVDYNTVELRDETDWSWDVVTSPFGPNTNGQGLDNIVDTDSPYWINNELQINGQDPWAYGSQYKHAPYQYEVHDVNTIADDNLASPVVGTAMIFNNTIPNEYIDIRNDAMLNGSGAPDPDNPNRQDIINITTGQKDFAGFTLDVLPDAEPGVYKFKVIIEFNRTTYAPLPSEDDAMPGYLAGDGISPGQLHHTEAFGPFLPYFWVPYNQSSQTEVKHVLDQARLHTGTPYGKISWIYTTWKKVKQGYDPLPGTDYKPGPNKWIEVYDHADPDKENSWEPIPDISTNAGVYVRQDLNASGLTGSPYSGYVDWDGDGKGGSLANVGTGMNVWMDEWSGPGATDYCFGVEPWEATWTDSWHYDVATDDDQSHTFPRGFPKPDHDYSFIGGGADDGNGTWQFRGLDWSTQVSKAHAGYEDHFEWENVVEEYWVQVRVFSASEKNFEDLDNDERGLKMIPPSAASDTYVTDNDKFEEFQVTISNGEYEHYKTFFDFNYTNLVATIDVSPNEQYFTVHGGGFARVNFITKDAKDLKFRISSKANTPPGYYYFTMDVDYTKIYYVEPGGNNDPRNDQLIQASETIIVEFFVEFSPDLAITDADLEYAQPGMRALNPTLTIDTGTNKTEINFTIENTGNVELIGDGQYIDYLPKDYDSMFGEIGLYIAGVELLGSPYYEDNEIANHPVYFDIDPIVVPKIGVGETVYVNVPVLINNNWDNPPGIYRIHMNYRGFYFDPGNFTPSSKFVYTEIRWIPTGAVKDKSWSYRDTDGDGQIGMIGPGGDARDETDGIFTDIEIVLFDPTTREIGINSFEIDGIPNGVITQGDTTAEIEIEFINNAAFEMMDIELMLSIGGNYFSVFSHYDINTMVQTEKDLKIYIPSLASGETYNHTFLIDGIDRLTPTGEHRLLLNYNYDFWELPAFMSSYGIIWHDFFGGPEHIGYIDEDADGTRIVADNNQLENYTYEGGYLAIDVIEDNLLDVIAVQQIGPNLGNFASLTGDQLDLGNEIRNSDIVIQLTSREYVQYSQVELFLDTMAPNPRTGGPSWIQVLENPITLDTQSIHGVFEVPATDMLVPMGGATNFAIFNVNLYESTYTEYGGVYPLNLTIRATNDDTSAREQYQTTVNLRVLPLDPILMIESVVPSTDIVPGEEFDLTITLRNTGKDYAREIYVTMSNDWYEDDPFFLVDAFITSISTYGTENYNEFCAGCTITNSVFARQHNRTTLGDLGITKTSEIVDAERVLMSPAAKINRLYISEIAPGTTANVVFRLKADTHMQEGKSYEELILLEFRDSFDSFGGLPYTWTSGPKYNQGNAYAITLSTKDNDKWPPKEEAEIELEATQAALSQTTWGLGVIIIILVILLVILWVRRRRAAEEEEAIPPEEEYERPSEDEEELEEEEEEKAEEEEGEEEEKAEEEEEEEDWGASEDEEEKAEEEEEEDWGASEDEEEKAEEEEEEEWSEASEEEEEEDWSSDKEKE